MSNSISRRPSDLSGVGDDDSLSAASVKRKTVYDAQMSAILKKYSSKDNMNLTKILHKYNSASNIAEAQPTRQVVPGWMMDEREPVEENEPVASSAPSRDERVAEVEERAAPPPAVESVTVAVVADTSDELQRVCSGLSNDNSTSTGGKSSASSKKSVASSKKSVPSTRRLSRIQKLIRSSSEAAAPDSVVVELPEEPVPTTVKEPVVVPVEEPPVVAKSIPDVLPTPPVLNPKKMGLSLADSVSNERSVSGSHSVASKVPTAAADIVVDKQPEVEMVDCSGFLDEVLDPKPDAPSEVGEAVSLKRVSSKASAAGSVSSRRSFLDKFRIRSSASAPTEIKSKEVVQVETVNSDVDESVATSGSQSPSKSRFFGGKFFSKNKSAAVSPTMDDLSAMADGCLLPTPDSVIPAAIEEAPSATAMEKEDEALRDQAFADTIPSCCSGTDKSAMETLDALAETYLLPTPDAEVEVTTTPTKKEATLATKEVAVTAAAAVDDEPVVDTNFCMNKSPTMDELDALAEAYLLPTPDVAAPEAEATREVAVAVANETAEGLEVTDATSTFCLNKTATMDTLDALAETYLLPTPDEPVTEPPVVIEEFAPRAIEETQSAPAVETKASALEALDTFAEKYLLPTPDVEEAKQPEKNTRDVLDVLSAAAPSSPVTYKSTNPLDVLDSFAETYLLPTPDPVAAETKEDEAPATKRKVWFNW